MKTLPALLNPNTVESISALPIYDVACVQSNVYEFQPQEDMILYESGIENFYLINLTYCLC